MTNPGPSQDQFGKRFLLFLTIAISIMFLWMIRGFLVAVLLAGIFSAMAQPLQRWNLKLVRGRASLASVSTIIVVLLLIVGPAAGFLTIVVSQAASVSQSVAPWVERQIANPDELFRLVDRLPFADRLAPYQDQIVAKVGEAASSVGGFLVSKMAAASRMTMSFLLDLFVMLYAMFFFLTGGRRILEKILFYIPLASQDENLMVERFVLVTKATLKGTLVIGMIQGTLAGLGFWVAGVNAPVFWGTVMGVLSIIPGIGSALVWIPAVIYLAAAGHAVASSLLGLWCLVVVGSVDNVLRPSMVGKDAKLSDLLILLSTLGGIVMFGAVGVIIGPIVAALFVTVWEIYGIAFKDVLPEVIPIDASSEWRAR